MVSPRNLWALVEIGILRFNEHFLPSFSEPCHWTDFQGRQSWTKTQIEKICARSSSFAIAGSSVYVLINASQGCTRMLGDYKRSDGLPTAAPEDSSLTIGSLHLFIYISPPSEAYVDVRLQYIPAWLVPFIHRPVLKPVLSISFPSSNPSCLPSWLCVLKAFSPPCGCAYLWFVCYFVFLPFSLSGCASVCVFMMAFSAWIDVFFYFVALCACRISYLPCLACLASGCPCAESCMLFLSSINFTWCIG